MDNLVIAQMAISASIAYGIEFLKKWKRFPWLTSCSKTLNRIVAGILSAFGAVGVHVVKDWDAGNHALTLTFTGLCLTCVITGVGRWLVTWLGTQVVYDVAISRKGNQANPVIQAEPVVVIPTNLGNQPQA